MAWIWWGMGAVAALVCVGLLAEAVAEARDAGRFPPPGRMVDVGGRRLHIRCEGSSSAGPGRATVVIEQGAGSPSIAWWPIQDQVASFARVCTYDRAGYQWSDPAPRRRSVQDRVDDLHAVLAGSGEPGPYILVGHSYGGPLVRLFARQYPAAVAGMVLVDTPEEAVIFRRSYEDYAQMIGRFARGLEVAARLGLVRFAAVFLREVPAGLSPEAFRALKSLVVRPAFFRAMGDEPASLSRVPASMHCTGGFGGPGDRPLIVLTHGQPFPGPAAVLEPGWLDGQHRLAQLSATGELIVAEHSNHMIQSDQPALVVDAIRRIVQSRLPVHAPQ